MQAIPRGRPEAAAAIWSWREGQGAAASESLGAIRVRGMVRSLLGGAVGVLVYLYLSHFMGTVVLTLATALLLAALASPTGAYAVAERAFASLGILAGRLMSWLILPVLFYAIFVPFGLIFRRGQKDGLQRFYSKERETYWSDRGDTRTASRNRERQY